jgi:hypothetical protein
MKRTSLDSVASPPTTSRRQSMAPSAASTAPGNVRVVCRFRPQNAIEQANNGNMCITFPSAKSVQIKDVDNNTPFTFDQIFQSDSEQQDIYEDVGRPVVADVLEGYNATIFACTILGKCCFCLSFSLLFTAYLCSTSFAAFVFHFLSEFELIDSVAHQMVKPVAVKHSPWKVQTFKTLPRAV